MERLSGIPASNGINMGRAFLYRESEAVKIPHYAIKKKDLNGEWRRFTVAVEGAKKDVKSLLDMYNRKKEGEHAKIFEAYLMMLDDEDFFDQIKRRLEARLENIESAVRDVSREMIQKLSTASDPYLRERVVDISDVSSRLLYQLMGVKRQTLSSFKEDVIVVAYDILPSDVLSMDKEHVKGIVTDAGSRTSHSAILARAFGVPAVLGLSGASQAIHDGDKLIVDGNKGLVIINPDNNTLDQHKKVMVNIRHNAIGVNAMRDLPAVTKDGHRVGIMANIALADEIKQAIDYGAEGIGLYRSEFLFLNQGQPPDEDAQYRAYSEVLRAVGDKPVTIRTLDLGGDKLLPNQAFDEKNPLLGWRAIRFCLAMPGLFKAQLRALLRSSVDGNLRIMFPMISAIEELEMAMAALKMAQDECREKGQAFREDIPVGIMVEIPAAAMMADILAGDSSFFSIGTNDLIQYSMAADRNNEKVSYLAQPLYPGVLRFIKRTLDAAHKAGIKAAMCGEMAGEITCVPLLLGLGLDEFSMTASSIPAAKQIIRGTSIKECQALANEVMERRTLHEVRQVLDEWLAARPECRFDEAAGENGGGTDFLSDDNL